MLITAIGIITIGTGMLGTIFGIVFIENTRDNTYINFSFLNVINFSFLNVNHARNDLKCYELRASFRP